MIATLIFLGYTLGAAPAAIDSLGVETIDGRVFVIHQVAEGETLYGISRHYGAPISTILDYNREADAGLEVGQILKIPYTPRSQRPAYLQVQPGGEQMKTHVVQAGETLFSISRMYEVRVEDIRRWNDLMDNTISIGQSLVIRSQQPVMQQQTPGAKGVHVVAAGETLYSISRQYGVEVRDIMTWNHLPTVDISVGQSLVVAGPMNAQATTAVDTPDVAVVLPTRKPDTAALLPRVRHVTISEAVKGSDEVRQSGLAELIEGTEGNRKYLALHRTAPAGTILKVMNELNNREVFVRVVGKLPDTALNKDLVLKISRSAYDRLGAIDPKFRVVVTYYK